MESTTTLVGLHQGSSPASSLRVRQTGDTASSPPPSSSSLLKTARNAKSGMNWTTRSPTWQAMAIAAFITAAYTFYFIFASPSGYSEYPLSEIQRRLLGNMLGVAHVWGGGTAMALGPFQFLSSLRRTGKLPQADTRNSAHSWIGRLYNLCVIAAGIGSLDVVKRSDLYDFGRWGFLALGAAWTVTAVLGWLAMWGDKPDIQSHKKWMRRNFALTYAAVMLRWQLPILIYFRLKLKFALSITGWSCWVPNVLFVDLIDWLVDWLVGWLVEFNVLA